MQHVPFVGMPFHLRGTSLRRGWRGRVTSRYSCGPVRSVEWVRQGRYKDSRSTPFLAKSSASLVVGFRPPSPAFYAVSLLRGHSLYLSQHFAGGRLDPKRVRTTLGSAPFLRGRHRDWRSSFTRLYVPQFVLRVWLGPFAPVCVFSGL